MNLSHHEKIMVQKAERCIFASCLQKGISNGIGGTIKQIAAKKNLQLLYKYQILNVYVFLKFMKDFI